MVVCAGCGKEMKEVCSSCWRCKSCGNEFCKEHMKRVLNGIIRMRKKQEK